MSVVDVRNLSKHYGEIRANDGLEFRIEEGEIFGYIGPNGAGKTTTIRLLLGFLAPTAGSVRLFGNDISDRRQLREAKSRIGYLPGDPEFDGTVTGDEYLDYQASLKGQSRRSELLDLFDPPLDRRIREYSRGNRQMLGIVQAFMHDPDLVVMDEPTTGLDPLKQEAFNRFLREERRRGLTALFSSHVLGEVRRVCDRVGIIRQGELVAVEEVDTLLRRGGKRVRVHTAGEESLDDLAGPGIVDVERFDGGAQFTFTGDYNRLLGTLSRYDVLDLEVEEAPLDDVLLHFYGGK
jgi:ABC-2 type transport system ATP-binding protein